MRGHWPGQAGCCRLGLAVPVVDQVALGHFPVLEGVLLDLGVQGADQGVLGHLPGWVDYLLGG